MKKPMNPYRTMPRMEIIAKAREIETILRHKGVKIVRVSTPVTYSQFKKLYGRMGMGCDVFCSMIDLPKEISVFIGEHEAKPGKLSFSVQNGDGELGYCGSSIPKLVKSLL